MSIVPPIYTKTFVAPTDDVTTTCPINFFAVGAKQRTLSVEGSITIQLVSSLTGLDSVVQYTTKMKAKFLVLPYPIRVTRC